MARLHPLLIALTLLLACASCKKHNQSVPIVVHVLRDPSAPFSDRLRRVDLQFALTKPRLANGAQVAVAANESGFSMLMGHLGKFFPEILILGSEADLPKDGVIRDQLGKPQFICGSHPAFIPISVTGELRQASQMYLSYVAAHCGNGR